MLAVGLEVQASCGVHLICARPAQARCAHEGILGARLERAMVDFEVLAVLAMLPEEQAVG